MWERKQYCYLLFNFFVTDLTIVRSLLSMLPDCVISLQAFLGAFVTPQCLAAENYLFWML